MPVIFEPITPKAFNSKAFVIELEKAAKQAEKGMLKDYQSGVSTWSHKVRFNSETTINPNGGLSIIVDTDDEIYTYVHEGTRAHDIKPRRAKRLRFLNTYTAKTIPGVIQSRSGGSSGSVVYSRGVRHPGFPGRYFSKPIRRKWQPLLQRQLQRALDKGAKESGHEYKS